MPTGQPQPERAPTGCRWGCVLILSAFVVIIGAIAWGAISTYRGAYQMTSPGPRTFPPVAQDGANAVDEKLQRAQEELGKGGSPEIHLAADELNAWFLGNPNNRSLPHHLRFRTAADSLLPDFIPPL